MSDPKKNLKKPNVSLELLQWLRDKFPNQVPSLSDDDRYIWCRVGQVELVRHLEKLYQEQQGP